MQTYQLVPVTHLQRGRYQPRIDFKEERLKELAQSIAQQGLIEPLVVRELTTDYYEIIAGERRWRAAILAGLTEIPCLIGEYSDQQAAALTLVENIQREELNLIEEASGYKRLVDEFNFSQEEIAVLVGKSRSHIANLLRLLTLCIQVQLMIRSGQLSLGHARLLVGLPSPQQLNLAQEIIEHDWSVRQVEAHIRALKNTNTAPFDSSSVQADIAYLERVLAEQVGAPVQITRDNERGGWLKVKFFDNDTLAGLLDRMGLRYD